MLKLLSNWLLSVMPANAVIDRFEKMRACAGALFGIVLTASASYLILGDAKDAVWLVGPMGASAVLLFAVPASPLAQPWSIIGGNVVSALVGAACHMLIDSPVLAAAAAASTAIGAMFALRCLHPPGGAIALTAVVGGPAVHAMGFGFALPVAINSLLLLATALFFNNATGRRYPHVPQGSSAQSHATKDPIPSIRVGIKPEDLDTVLTRHNQLLDVSRDDLMSILLEAEMLAHRRRFGDIRCADVMAKDVISVEFGTSLQETWDRLHRHRLTALPVVNRADRRIAGIITKADFIAHSGLDHVEGLGKRLARLLLPVRHTHSIKPEVAGQIMNRQVRTAQDDQPVIELVPLLSDSGLHSIPVLDEERRLVGMLTQSDMIAPGAAQRRPREVARQA